MSAHTPGPWEFYGDNNYGGTVEIGPRLTVSVDRADRFDSSMAINREEMEANGRLIAAAPDLLAALEALCPKVLSGTSGMDEAIAAAESAIAKARGGK